MLTGPGAALRFENTFFTVIAANDPSLPAAAIANSAPGGADYTLADLMAEIQTLQNPVPAQGNSIISTVEDLQAEGRINRWPRHAASSMTSTGSWARTCSPPRGG